MGLTVVVCGFWFGFMWVLAWVFRLLGIRFRLCWCFAGWWVLLLVAFVLGLWFDGVNSVVVSFSLV